ATCFGHPAGSPIMAKIRRRGQRGNFFEKLFQCVGDREVTHENQYLAVFHAFAGPALAVGRANPGEGRRARREPLARARRDPVRRQGAARAALQSCSIRQVSPVKFSRAAKGTRWLSMTKRAWIIDLTSSAAIRTSSASASAVMVTLPEGSGTLALVAS